MKGAACTSRAVFINGLYEMLQPIFRGDTVVIGESDQVSTRAPDPFITRPAWPTPVSIFDDNDFVWGACLLAQSSDAKAQSVSP